MTRFDDIAIHAGRIAVLPAEGSARRRFDCPRCGRDMGRNVWACEDCAGRDLAGRRDGLLASARDSVPAKFRGVRLSSPELAQRVSGTAAVIGAARAALTGARPVVTILGASGKGKTTLACAMLTEVIEAGAVLTCEPAVLERAKFARFVDALQLSLARSEHRLGGGAPGDVLRAKNASMLVIDEFGKDDKRAVDVAKIIHDREAAQRLTVVATWLNQAEIAAAYDGAVARRLFEKATVIRLGVKP